MKHGSLFAGVDGLGMGFIRAGFETAFRVEWDAAAVGVLANHYHNDPLYCDVSKFYPDPRTHAIDVLDGGSPCQDLSVAGNRAGLDGERSGLFRQMVRIAKRLRPRFIVWENVAGAFSSNSGRDFAAVIRAFTGMQVEVPKEGWGNAGCVRTPFPSLRWSVAWRIFDSQWCGVPQRRRRIFLVASLGDASCAEILFESESVRGDHPPSRGTGEDITGTLSARTKGGGGLGTDFDVAGGLIPEVICASTGQAGSEIGIGIGTTLNCNHEAPFIASALRGHSDYGAGNPSLRAEGGDCGGGSECLVAHTLRGEGFDASEDGTGRGTPLIPVVIPILEAGARTGASTDDPRAGIGIGEAGDPMFTLQATKQHAVAFAENSRAELRLEGGDGNVAGCLSSGGGKPGQGQPVIASQSRFARNGRGGPSETVDCLTGEAGETGKGDSAPLVAGTAYGVRRLLPIECERLQSWADDHTKFKRDVRLEGNRWIIGEAIKEQADGPRYKQAGNGVTTNVAEWIAKRIAATLKREGEDQ